MTPSSSPVSFMRTATISAVISLSAALGYATASAAGPVGSGDFDARQLLRGPVIGDESGPSLSLNGTGRFSMRQSYSLSAMSGGGGSASSGLYLNTLSYQFSPLLTASVDVGFHTPLHSSLPGASQGAGAGAGSIVVPRLGLEYRPTDRLSFNLEVVNGPDAWKAYGGPWSPHFFQGSRTP